MAEGLGIRVSGALAAGQPLPSGVDLPTPGTNETQAADLRPRFNPFAGDWDRPAAAIYDQAPAR